ncbi:tyrosine decarboxylase 1-like [Aegilops tauschii subsp. strangulata]|nr:tyrosine decarboxylase 1-like [Aegilops tauschii subsp. strangulata]
MEMGGAPFDALMSLDPETFARESRAVINFLAGYYRDVEKYPVQPEAMPGCLRTLLPDAPPENGEQMDVILEEVWRHIVPALTHWQSPKFFGYFQANASTAGFAGEMLSTGLNVVPFTRAASPAATELESVVMDWMGKLAGLPDCFLFSGGGGGVLHGSTCEAVVCTLAAARDRALSRLSHEGILRLVVYASDQSHSTFQKGARIVGVPRSNFRVIPTSAASSYGLTAASVRDAVEADVASGLVPLYLCATVGTTGLGAVDPVRDLGELAREHGIWLHVDAAYAGSALICPEFHEYIDGAELADSVSMNPHKWFLTNMDCCCLWVASPAALTSALSTNPEYLSNVTEESAAGAGVVDYKDWQIALSRPFRAIKLWVVLRRYGGAGMRAYIRRHVEMARWFERALEADERFEVIAPTRFSLVTFPIRPWHEGDPGDDAVDALNRKLLVAVNGSGRAFMTHFMVDGKFVIRMAVGGAMTRMRHVQDTWELVREKAKEVGALTNDSGQY